MNFAAYRKVFATPGLRSLMVVGLLAKMPGLGIPAVVVLHVSGNLGLGFGLGGLVTAAWTVGAGIGSPLEGRAMDKWGLRPLIAAVVLVQGAFWGAGPFLPYPALLCASFAAGLVTLPAFTIIRIALAVMVPQDIRHTAYVADSLTTDLAYMAGPSLGVLLASQASPATAFFVMGGLLVLSAVAYAVLNPPVRGASSQDPTSSGVRLRDWMTPQMLGVLVATAGICLAVVGLEVAAIGTLQDRGEIQWTWVFLIGCGAASIAGGLVYGAMPRPPSVLLITILLGLLLIPVGLAPDWVWLCVLVLPANAMCAPALSGTADLVSRLAPEGSRGAAMGTYASALLIGSAAGSPLAGASLDLSGPFLAFASVGAACAVAGGVAWVGEGRWGGTPAVAADEPGGVRGIPTP
ncbi:MFS transporter [Streptomyces sp. NBC_01304]|uniref:MFS transporter n=1 Tax=Streptomyces sp. NBC_01304 TaxID=2903818 RepID=UPI002E0EBEA4|nr:MFS transporter [Streptomyces sp. NBC_01304]